MVHVAALLWQLLAAAAQTLIHFCRGPQNRNSVCHSAIIFANALMHKGTTVDAFLRENLEWLSRATNWAKFSATAGLGVIHSGHLSQVCSLWEFWHRAAERARLFRLPHFSMPCTAAICSSRPMACAKYLEA